MKKIMLLASIIFITFLGCSKDDDGVKTTTPPVSTDLIGTWSLDYFIQDNALTEEINCDEQVKYVFASNKTYTKTTFSGMGTSGCVVAVIINGTWIDQGTNNYELTPNGGSAGPTLNITFQDNFTKFIFEVSATRTEVFAKQ